MPIKRPKQEKSISDERYQQLQDEIFMDYFSDVMGNDGMGGPLSRFSIGVAKEIQDGVKNVAGETREKFYIFEPMDGIGIS